jgi:hypothetical protein
MSGRRRGALEAASTFVSKRIGARVVRSVRMRRGLFVSRGGAFAVGAVAIATLGCGKSLQPEAPPPAHVLVKVTGDPGRPLPGARVTYAGKTIATTGEDGIAKLELNGRQGDAYEVAVVCPAGHESPNKTLLITLRRLADPTSMAEYDVTCPKATRSVVVAVRAENGAGLPVLYLGREVARTDGSGAAHVLLANLPRDAQFDLMLDTSGKSAEQLRPKSPRASFAVKGQDDVLVFDQHFTIEAKPHVYHPVKKKPPGPVALPTKITP